jgi:WD40 repeat protein
MIVSGSDDDTVKVWSREGILLKTLEGHGGNVRSVTFSPDSKTIASGGQDTKVKLWKLQGTELQTFDLNQLLTHGCSRLHDYLKTNPNISSEERQLCS